MLKQVAVISTGNTLSLKGVLCLANVMLVYKQISSHFKSGQDMVIDCSDLKSSDSSGIALFIECLKFDQKQGVKVSFLSIPQELHALIKVSGLDFLF